MHSPQIDCGGGEGVVGGGGKRRMEGKGEGETEAKRMKRVAELVLVMSAMGKMRGGREPTAVEMAMMAEARKKVASLCEVLSPKDILPREVFSSVVDDLGLNRLRDQRLGFRPPKLPISDRIALAKRRMEESKAFASQSAPYTSERLQSGNGAASENRGTPPPVPVQSTDKVGPTRTFQPPNTTVVHTPPVQTSSVHVTTAASAPLPAVTAPRNVGKDSTTVVPTRTDRAHLRSHGRPNWPSEVPEAHGRPNWPSEAPQAHGRPNWPSEVPHVPVKKNVGKDSTTVVPTRTDRAHLRSHGRPNWPSEVPEAHGRPNWPSEAPQAHGRPNWPSEAPQARGRPNWPSEAPQAHGRPNWPSEAPQAHGRPNWPSEVPHVPVKKNVGKDSTTVVPTRTDKAHLRSHGRPNWPSEVPEAHGRPNWPSEAPQALGRPNWPSEVPEAHGRPNWPSEAPQARGRPNWPSEAPQARGRPNWPSEAPQARGRPNWPSEAPQARGRPNWPSEAPQARGRPNWPSEAPQARGRPNWPSEAPQARGRPNWPSEAPQARGRPNWPSEAPQARGRPNWPSEAPQARGRPNWPSEAPQAHGRPNWPSEVPHVPASSPADRHNIRTNPDQIQPQPPSRVNIGAKNKAPDQLPSRVGNTGGTQMAAQPAVVQTPKPVASQTAPGSTPTMHHNVQGSQFASTPAINHHVEISKVVQRLLNPKLPPRPIWTPPSREYMNKAHPCQFCKLIINDVETVVICDACEKAFHLGCLQSHNVKSIPKGEWHCPRCLAMSHGKPFPPKYGRVTRNMNAPKAPSNTSVSHFQSEKKMQSVNEKLTQPNPTTNGSVNVRLQSQPVNVAQPSYGLNLSHGIDASKTAMSVATKKEVAPNMGSGPTDKIGTNVGSTVLTSVQPSTDKPLNQIPKSEVSHPRYGFISETKSSTPIITHSNSASENLLSSSNQNDIQQKPSNCDESQPSQHNDSNKVVECYQNYNEERCGKGVKQNMVVTDKVQDQAREGIENSESELYHVDWIGEIDKVADGKNFFRSCSVNGVVYHVQSYALFRSNTGKLTPFRLQGMWEDSEASSKWLIVHKCYFPDDLPGEVGRPGGPQINEVYESTHDSIVKAGSVQGPCEVLPFRKFGEQADASDPGALGNGRMGPVFVRNWFYDESKRAFCPSAS